MLLKRVIEDEVLKYLCLNKVVVFLGLWRVGKMVLI